MLRASRAAYCTKTGGLVEYRKPYYNTNSDPSQWLVLAVGGEGFCQYTRKSDGSRIHISLSSLNARGAQPGRAGLLLASPVEPARQWQPGIVLLHATGRLRLVRRSESVWWRLGEVRRDRARFLKLAYFPGQLDHRLRGGCSYSLRQGTIRGKNLAYVLRFKNPYAAEAKQ